MGTSVYLIGAFHRESWHDSTVVDAHRAFVRAGFESDPATDPDVVTYESQDATYDTVRADRDLITTAMERSADDHHMHVQYESDTDSIRVTYRFSPDTGDLPMPVGFGNLDAHYFDPEAVGEDAVSNRVERFSEAFVEVSNAVDPDVGYLRLRNDHAGMEGVPSGTDPSEHAPDELPFMLALGKSWVEYCGGHDRIADGPVHATQALDTGGVVVQVSERPDVNGDYHDGAEYLFGER